jgi:hypothetical protein
MAIIFFRIAAGLIAFVSLGFGIPAVLGALHLARTGEVWRLWGFPTYGPGSFVRHRRRRAHRARSAELEHDRNELIENYASITTGMIIGRRRC